eukprot:1150882-Rhodomonas_salina.1
MDLDFPDERNGADSVEEVPNAYQRGEHLLCMPRVLGAAKRGRWMLVPSARFAPLFRSACRLNNSPRTVGFSGRRRDEDHVPGRGDGHHR